MFWAFIQLPLFFFFLSCSLYASDSFSFRDFQLSEEVVKKGKGEYFLVISKKHYRLFIFDKKNQNPVIDFPVALGMNKGRKAVHNDNKTPEGVYFIKEILSASKPVTSESYQKLMAMNRIYWKAKDGNHLYQKKNQDLGRNAYGPRVIKLSYPNKEDMIYLKSLKEKGLIAKDARPGSWTGIHGTKEPQAIEKDASSGCVRMLNDDIVKLDPYIRIGTLVFILP